MAFMERSSGDTCSCLHQKIQPQRFIEGQVLWTGGGQNSLKEQRSVEDEGEMEGGFYKPLMIL